VDASHLNALVAQFGIESKAKLAGGGEQEEALRVPIEHLVAAFGSAVGYHTVLDGEVHLTELSSRPDFAVRVKGAVVGYLEVKRADVSLNPSTFTGHNLSQWNRLRDLPNLVYTNGLEWRLYRGEGIEPVVAKLSGGSLTSAGQTLTPDSQFEILLTNFLVWKPAPIRTVSRLVKTIAPITRMLRTKVVEQLAIEHQNVSAGKARQEQQFLGLASDWRALLFPDATDAVFADGYAQTVTFALLLARTENIDLSITSLHEVGASLGTEHSLMGKALQLLTDSVKGNFLPTIELLTRVVGAVEWDAVRKTKDTYLHLYENFLTEYDPELRRASGTYYTPHQVVDEMVRLTEDVLVSQLQKPAGFLDPTVTTIDPAMGTGTYLHAIIERVAERVAAEEGPGAVPGTIQDLAQRLIGFELQLGSFAVAELRTTDLLRSYDASPPEGGMRMFVADTLSDPHAVETQLGSGLGAISDSKRKANKIKSDSKVTVVIGNPPYGDKAEGHGGWIEDGSKALINERAPKGLKVRPLDDFRVEGNGLTEYVLKNYYIYFWRWATWKVFESVPQDTAGVVCFISTAGYLRGAGTKGMREYLRREADEGWIIDLTPEGMRPEVNTRIFPGVQQPLSIGIFVRRANHDSTTPAPVHYKALSGKQGEKFKQLKAIELGTGWELARDEWRSPLTPAPETNWDSFPALADLFGWVSPGLNTSRTWAYAPSVEILKERWQRIVTSDLEGRRTLMRESVDSTVHRVKPSLPGQDTTVIGGSIADETNLEIRSVRTGYRAFDRQYVIPDARIIDRARVDLWHARQQGQVYIFEQHNIHVLGGPGLLFFGGIPDLNAYQGSNGGRTFPLLHPDGSANVAPGLLVAIGNLVGHEVSAPDLLAYLACLTANPGYTALFHKELTTPGIRVPITRDTGLWDLAVETGRTVTWLHTYGEAFSDIDESREIDNVRSGWPSSMQPLSKTPVTEMPVSHGYEDVTSSIFFVSETGAKNGSWGPVPRAVLDYQVNGMNVVSSWLKYRKKVPGGKKTSPLDHIHVTEWPHAWTIEFTKLLTVLTRLVALEATQMEVLDLIVRGPLASRTELADLGALWPSTKKDRSVRHIATTIEKDTMLDGMDLA
jgi:hypothetical protein